MNIIIKLTLAILLTTGLTAAQTLAPIADKSDRWNVFWRVSVKGDFTVEPEVGTEGPFVAYTISREYEGKAIIGLAAAFDQPTITVGALLFKNIAPNVTITINDSKRTYTDPICGDYGSVRETWKGIGYSDTNGNPLGSALLLINNQKLQYKFNFPLEYNERKYSDPVEHRTIYTSHFRTGEQKETGNTSRNLPLALFPPPNIKGYIEKGVSLIRSADWSELKPAASGNGSLSFVSEILHPDEPLIDGVPESKDKVNVIIYFNFSKS